MAGGAQAKMSTWVSKPNQSLISKAGHCDKCSKRCFIWNTTLKGGRVRFARVIQHLQHIKWKKAGNLKWKKAGNLGMTQTLRRLLKSLPDFLKHPLCGFWFLVIQFWVCLSSSPSTKINGRAWANERSTKAVNLWGKKHTINILAKTKKGDRMAISHNWTISRALIGRK